MVLCNQYKQVSSLADLSARPFLPSHSLVPFALGPVLFFFPLVASACRLHKHDGVQQLRLIMILVSSVLPTSATMSHIRCSHIGSLIRYRESNNSTSKTEVATFRHLGVSEN